MNDIFSKHKEIFLLILILSIGAFFRLYNPNWDEGSHIHPDERFLTMVGNSMLLPKTFFEYLDPHTSTFNPRNTGNEFFVYGLFPLTINKIFALLLKTDTYNDFTIQGRLLSGVADAIVIVLVYATAKLLEKKYNLDSSIKFFSSFLYAMAVLPIQLSHFFAVDTFLNLFLFGSFYLALRFSTENQHSQKRKPIIFVILSAFFFGLALASKITGLFILPLSFTLILYSYLPSHVSLMHFLKYPLHGIRIIHKKKSLQTILKIKFSFLLMFILYLLLSYLTLRLANPYIFETNNIINPTINKNFVVNLQTLKSFDNKDAWFPPAVQWVNKPSFLYVLGNLAVLGVGIPYFILILLGMYLMFLKKNVMMNCILVWVLMIVLYQSLQFTKNMRYLLIVYPFLAVFAGFAFSQLFNSSKKIIGLFFFILILLWPASFMSVYLRKHSRVNASEWIYQHIPNQSFILGEHWDDALPLQTENMDKKQFTIDLLPVFGSDTPEKWQNIDDLLQKGDYLILSSNRGWGSIPTVPERYPRMTQFYKDLFSNKLSYKNIKEFTSYPSLQYLGIPITINDDWADESFTVYDHPKVIIFQKK